MSKVAVVYWSGTGNTEAMAVQVAQSAKEAGAEVTLFQASMFSGDMVDRYDVLAFGCPSMGVEVLEEEEFAPMFEGCRPHLSGKKIALFGSYGWGDGEWMRNWEADCSALGAVFVHDSVLCNEAPDDEGLAACAALGTALAG